MPVFAGLGALVAGSLGVAGPVTAGTAAAIGTATAAVGAGAIGAAASGIGAAAKSMIPKTPQMPSMPNVPNAAETVKQITDTVKETAVAKASSKRAAAARTRTIFTSPRGLGIMDLGQEAATAKKTLLGQ